jgi:hypothetical protein
VSYDEYNPLSYASLLPHKTKHHRKMQVKRHKNVTAYLEADKESRDLLHETLLPSLLSGRTGFAKMYQPEQQEEPAANETTHSSVNPVKAVKTRKWKKDKD